MLVIGGNVFSHIPKVILGLMPAGLFCIHTLLLVTNQSESRKWITRSALIMSNGTPSVCVVYARNAHAVLLRYFVRRLFLQKYAQCYSSGFYCLKLLKEENYTFVMRNCCVWIHANVLFLEKWDQFIRHLRWGWLAQMSLTLPLSGLWHYLRHQPQRACLNSFHSSQNESYAFIDL